MIAAWMLYSLIIGGLVSLAAHGIEAVCGLSGRPRRWVWVMGLATTVVLTCLAPRRASVEAPALVPLPTTVVSVAGPISEPSLYARALSIIERIPAMVAGPFEGALTEIGRIVPGSIDWGLAVIWLGLTGGMLLILLATHWRYRRVRPEWPVGDVGGARVRIAPALGPAVMGLFKPEIVIPRWLLGRSEQERGLVIAHEREHVRTRDPLLLAGAQLVTGVLAWNPAAWWMLARFRLALELDCDARVLRQGVGARRYGSLLIDLAGQCSGLHAGAPALSDRSSHLERRLSAMKPQIPRFALARATALAALALVSLLVACTAELPTSEEIDRMDVASAEAGAARVALVSNSDENLVYVVDHNPVSADQAHALSPDEIGSVMVYGVQKLGDTARVVITTMDAADTIPAPDSPAPPPPPDGPAPPPPPSPGATGLSDFDGILIVDGVRTDRSALNRIRPGSIESINVIKGAAAEDLYGSRGANGVIIVTTKKAPPPPAKPSGTSLSNFEGVLLVDGARVDPVVLQRIPPEDIQSIDVIKSPAALEAYPDPAARNGVIRVTTKKAGAEGAQAAPAKRPRATARADTTIRPARVRAKEAATLLAEAQKAQRAAQAQARAREAEARTLLAEAQKARRATHLDAVKAQAKAIEMQAAQAKAASVEARNAARAESLQARMQVMKARTAQLEAALTEAQRADRADQAAAIEAQTKTIEIRAARLKARLSELQTRQAEKGATVRAEEKSPPASTERP